MNVARSVADVLSKHVSFEVDCIDRMYLNVYVPGSQYPAGLVGYVQRQLGLPIASAQSWLAARVRYQPRDRLPVPTRQRLRLTPNVRHCGW